MIIKHDKLFSYYIKSTFKGVIGVTFILILISIASVMQPLISKKILDVISLQSSEENIKLLLEICLQYLAIGVIISILNYLKVLVSERVYKRATRKVRTDVLETISNFTYEKINSFDKGFLFSRVNNSAERMSTLFSLTIPTILGNVLFLVLVVMTIGKESKMFAIMMIAIILISMVIISFLIVYGRSFLAKSNRNGLKRQGQYIETLNGMKYIKMHRILDKLLEKLTKISNKEYKYAMKTVVINSSVNSFISLGENLIVAALIIRGLNNLGSANSFTVAQIYLLITYIRKIFEPIYLIVDEFDKMQKSISSYLGIRRLLNFESDLNGEKRLKPFRERVTKIEFVNVSYSLDNNIDALKNANFKIRAGERVALVGHLGKLSIVDLMLKLFLPKNGQIKINNMPLKKYSGSSIREKITIIEQDPAIFKGTLLDNIVMYEEDPNIVKVDKIIASTKLDRYLTKSSLIQEDGKNIPTGVRQLISLARAMYKDAEIYVWNETVSMLDVEIQNTMNKLINQMTEDKTLIIVAHRPNTIKTCNRILNVKEDGVNEVKLRTVEGI